MPDYSLILVHWSALPPPEVAAFVFIFIFFSVLFSLEICTRLLRRRRSDIAIDPDESPANPRVQSVCDGIRGKKVSSCTGPDTDQESRELCEYGELLRQ